MLSTCGFVAQSLSGGVGPKLVANTYDPAMAVGPASGAGSYRLYALLQPTYFSGYQPGYATVGTFLYNVGRRTFSYQTRYSTSAASRTVSNTFSRQCCRVPASESWKRCRVPDIDDRVQSAILGHVPGRPCPGGQLHRWQLGEHVPEQVATPGPPIRSRLSAQPCAPTASDLHVLSAGRSAADLRRWQRVHVQSGERDR